MRFIKFIKGTRMISLLLVAGVLIGFLGFSAATADIFKDERRTPYPEYKVNEYGQTYGSDQYADSIEEEPDLIAATGENNIDGYLRKEDVFRPMPKSPEEAVARNEFLKYTTIIPLYASDGRTVVGEFKEGDGKIQITLEEMKVLEADLARSLKKTKPKG